MKAGDLWMKTSHAFVKLGLYRACILASVLLHLAFYAGYYAATHSSEEFDSADISNRAVEVDFEDMPPELIGGTSSPAPVEKQDWIEGTGKDKSDAPAEDVDFNKYSGDGTDKDGYFYSFNGDRAPAPIYNFDLKQYFPEEAKKANITKKTVMMLVQVDEFGNVKSARQISQKAGYGFDEAAMIVMKRLRFSPGYIKGKPVKMAHELPIEFLLK